MCEKQFRKENNRWFMKHRRHLSRRHVAVFGYKELGRGVNLYFNNRGRLERRLVS